MFKEDNKNCEIVIITMQWKSNLSQFEKYIIWDCVEINQCVNEDFNIW